MEKKFYFKLIISAIILSLFISAKSAIVAQNNPNDKNKEGFSLLLVIDCSGSMEENNRLASAKKAAKSQIQSLSGTFEVAVMSFAGCGGASVIQGFTSDKSAAMSAVGGLGAGGATPLSAAASKGCSYLKSNAKYKTKSMILLTDGVETCGGNTSTACSLGGDGGSGDDDDDEDKDQEYPSDLM